MSRRATVPREVPADALWDVAVVTRTGLAAVITPESAAPSWHDPAPRAPPSTLYWFGPAGVRRVELGVRDPVPWATGVALDDGGAVVLALRGETTIAPLAGAPVPAPLPEVLLAIRLSPDGVELGRRAVALARGVRALAGVGQLGERWGIVVAPDTGADDVLTLLGFDGADVPVGRWPSDATPAPCGDRTPDTLRLHALRVGDGATPGHALPITLGPNRDGEDFARARLATFERTGDRVCVRRIWGVRCTHRSAPGDEAACDAWSAVRLDARGDRLVGVFDDGRSIVSASVTVDDQAAP